MEESWENWPLQMEMDDGIDILEMCNTSHDDEDDELFLREILLQPSLSSESDESDHQYHPSFHATTNSYSTTLQDNNNFITVVQSDVPVLDQTAGNSINMVKSDSSNSLVSQQNGSKNKKPHRSSPPPRTYILSFDNSTMTPATPESEPYPKNHNKLVKGNEGITRSSSNNSPNNFPSKRTTMTETRVRDDSANNNSQGANKKTRTSSQTMDHIMAERKRRQELTERFIALSATIPGLSKTDKASILRAAIDYVKQLQERIQELEKQDKLKTSVESVIKLVRNDKSNVCANHHGEEINTTTTSSVTTTSSDDCCGTLLPEIEARVMGKEVLIEVHCEKGNGIELKILDVLENNLHLGITGSSVLPFGNSALGITVIAQMGESNNMTVNDIVKNLRELLLTKKNSLTHGSLKQ